MTTSQSIHKKKTMADTTKERMYGFDPEWTIGECLIADPDNRVDGDVVSDLAGHIFELQRENESLRKGAADCGVSESQIMEALGAFKFQCLGDALWEIGSESGDSLVIYEGDLAAAVEGVEL
jgi:hypothetical protein